MIRSSRALALMTTLILGLTACGGTASPAPARSSSTPAAHSPSPSGAGTLPGAPSLGADQELERRLPDQVGSEILRKVSFRGAQYFANAGSAANDFRDVLGAVGRSPDDFTIALAVSNNVKMGAFRVKGIDSAVLLPAYVQAGIHNTPGSTVADASVGGKSVKKVTIPDQTEFLYLYPNGDALFFAQATTAALLSEALSKLA
jgi:hypothetical protein